MYQADLDVLRATRQHTLELIEGLTQAQTAFSPGSGQWSVGEVLDHLLLVEALNRREIAALIDLATSGRRPYLKRTFADVNVSMAYIPKSLLPFLEVPFRWLSRVVPRVAREFMMRHRLVPAQSPDVGTPRQGRSIDELRAELGTSLHEMQALFEANPTLDYRAMLHQHPLMGANNVLQLLRLGALHEQRHQSQIGDILRLPGFPREA
ncbi:MAG TPA: DinB family protein [Terriglobales bacterium]|nr:DinB family protein [Terriglobales bacterium]